MICPRCGEKIPNDSVFCQECGHKLDTSQGKRPKRCEICGTYNDWDALFCERCGQPLEDDDQEDEKKDGEFMERQLYYVGSLLLLSLAEFRD